MNSNHFKDAGFTTEYNDIYGGRLFKKDGVDLFFMPRSFTLRDKATQTSFPNTTNSGALYVGSASDNLKSAILFTDEIHYNSSMGGACFVRCEKIK